MKTLVKIWLLMAAIAVGASLCAAPKSRTGRSVIIPRELTSVQLFLTAAPRIGHDQQTSEKVGTRKWLQVRIAYQFNPSLKFKDFFTYDDMRVEIYMRVVPSNGTWRGLRWFSGTQYLYKVIPESRSKEKHYVSFFMPPGLLHNYVRRNEKSILKDCAGVVFFYNGDRLLGRAFFDNGSSSSRQTEKNAGRLLAEYNLMLRNPNLLVKDGLWPREMSPWRSLDAGRYDLPRPDIRKEAPSAPSAVAPAEEKKDDESGNVSNEKKEEEEEEMKFTRSSGSKKKKSRGRK